jgi:hypothetical protein
MNIPIKAFKKSSHEERQKAKGNFFKGCGKEGRLM